MQVRILPWGSLTDQDRRRILARSEKDIAEVQAAAGAIIEAVRAGGDAALVQYTRRFGGADISGMPLRVAEGEIDAAESAVSEPVRAAIRASIANVRRCHQEQLPPPMTLSEIRPGVCAGERATAVESVGLYAPRGKGSFPSSTYMMAVPAQVAGVERVVLVSPPDAGGRCDPATLYAAAQCGVREIYRVGGVQALAALAYGTESIRPVVKFLGPGNQYVTAAKRLLAGVVDVGLPAGPSESMIIADSSADPRLLALDLLIEAEHGPDSQAILVTPRSRARPCRRCRALREGGRASRAARVVRQGVVRRVRVHHHHRGHRRGGRGRERGGPRAPADRHRRPAGDPWPRPQRGRDPPGPEHALLPGQLLHRRQRGAADRRPGARRFSALSVRDFLKFSSVASLTAGGYSSLQDTAIALADYEGFAAHAKALRERRPDGSRKA